MHFGHQTKRWNPKWSIFGEQGGIYVMTSGKTAKLFKEAEDFVTKLASEGKTILCRHEATGPGCDLPKNQCAAACIT